MAALSETDILNMSDEEFLKTNPEPGLTPSESTETTTNQETPETPEVDETPEVEGEETSSNQDDETPEETPETDAPGSEEAKPEETAQEKAQRERDEQGRFKAKEDAKPETKTEDDKSKVDAQAQAPVVNYEAAYKEIMAPFKANGRTIELKDPKEAVQLMQMGANYTKKMQELVPHRKVLTMLQNNGLLDEGKLSYLIDLSQKNPEAIKKLVKDAGIDPMEIDVNAESAYREGNHKVSDEEVAFHTTLDDMKSAPEKLETLRVINDGWDQASKEALWKNPAIMTVMHDQRANGIYDRIANEIARRQTLGTIPAGTPFLHAYKLVGDELYAQPPQAPVVAQPVVTRVQAPKPQVTNSQRAAAVSPSRSRPANAKANVDFLNMSDDEFLKKFEGRV